MASELSHVAANVLPVNPIAGRDTPRPIEERLARYNCPGAAICVIRGGEVADAGGFGEAEAGRRMEADTVFAGASISKPIAAVLAMQLVEEGRVGLDQPVNEVLQAWRVPENAYTDAVPVTLRHLLSHTAGLTVHGFGDFPGSRGPTPLETLTGRPPAANPPVVVDKTPGGSVRYSGGGTTAVELMLEELTGERFADLARRRIFDPLGMRRTTFGQPLPEAFHAITAVGHDALGRPLPRRFTYTPQLAAGGVYTSAPDYARFMVECRRAWLGEDNVLLGREATRAMMTRQGSSQFGLGWELVGGAAMRFGHGGSNDGYQCNATCFLESGDGVVVLTNALLGIILHAELLNAVAAAYGWPDVAPPRRIRELPPETQALYVGRYRVVSGVSAPHLDIWTEEGKLYSRIEGLIFPPREMFLDLENGRFFGQQTPAETAITMGPDGRARDIVVLGEGDVEILRAVREDAAT
ncbi:serine hydrolase domain-containing protein [Phenylobacterium sp. SCN 70-31]|uniref:serine hydrolase domain-containing protein n=1 Tax=Phenylobacterium sp. SCN 70-31 TaxID=1660129 RepID=UPI00086E8A16|nr:serine hydrolase domain-containing protein [Phenylobacterium sp. SCN 70-31]ODT88370.1 MAG: hypothetical protein ABS78_07060 [Phenylobacterium sp. SCN 70-31]